MGHSKMNIVCYTGGTCGDMISAILDPVGTRFRHTAVMIEDSDRSRLKKPHLFQSDQEKDQYLIEIEKKYQSIPSHDLDYHVRKKHDFIGITVQDKATALWAAKRFKQLHRAHVWEEMTALSGVNSVEEYAQMMIDFSNLITQHTDRVVSLESIRAGTALDNPILKTASKNLYRNWLDLQNGVFII
jgi:glycerol kinase